MYLENLGFHSITRLLGISHVSVLNWICKYGNQLDEIRNLRPIKIMELYEVQAMLLTKKLLMDWY